MGFNVSCPHLQLQCYQIVVFWWYAEMLRVVNWGVLRQLLTTLHNVYKVATGSVLKRSSFITSKTLTKQHVASSAFYQFTVKKKKNSAITFFDYSGQPKVRVLQFEKDLGHLAPACKIRPSKVSSKRFSKIRKIACYCVLRGMTVLRLLRPRGACLLGRI
jgi:hypothetical protein